MKQNIYDEEVSRHLAVPCWINQDITFDDCRNIAAHGCGSGVYMPAANYLDASLTMYEHGDDVLRYIEERGEELPRPPDRVSWRAIAAHYLSYAVEFWASEMQSIAYGLKTEKMEH